MRNNSLLFLFVFGLPIISGHAIEPADPDLIPAARKVLDYLSSVYGKKVLSGVSGTDNAEKIEAVSGKLPAIKAIDPSGWNTPTWGKTYTPVVERTIEAAIQWRDQGGIVAMQFHWKHPGKNDGTAWVGKHGKNPPSGPFDMAGAVKPGTESNQQFLDDLNRHADYLEKLAEAKVPVLWRPLHEIDGGWFWWTDREHPENTATAWRLMFDTLVKERGIHNLIWVYSAALKTAENGQDVERIELRKRFYPGDACVNIDGNRGERACWNHPDYRHWVAAHVGDLFSNYALDGIQYGAERNGPLSRLIDWARETPTCCCGHCRSRAEKEGVDFERAKAGLAEMTRFIRNLEKGGEPRADGALVEFLRILMQHPEIFDWEQMHYRAGEELHQLVFDTVKAIRPEAQVGRHIDHAQIYWDILFRAAMPYSRMTPCSDFLKISTYHDIIGPRLSHRIEKGYCETIFHGLPPEHVLAFFYAATGNDPGVEPPFDRLAEEGRTPEYVYRETKRAVEGVGGEAKIYSGISIDISRGGGWGNEASPSDSEEVYRAVGRAFDAGAFGIVVCREYEEMHEPSLRAVGRAVREQSAG